MVSSGEAAIAICRSVAGLFAVGLLSTGCTIVQVNGPARATVAKFGILKIEPEGDARLVTYRSSGVGLVPSVNGATLGISSETVAIVLHPEDCRLVIFEMTAQEVATLREVLAQTGEGAGSLCIVGGDDEEMDRDTANSADAGGVQLD